MKPQNRCHQLTLSRSLGVPLPQDRLLEVHHLLAPMAASPLVFNLAAVEKLKGP